MNRKLIVKPQAVLRNDPEDDGQDPDPFWNRAGNAGRQKGDDQDDPDVNVR